MLILSAEHSSPRSNKCPSHLRLVQPISSRSATTTTMNENAESHSTGFPPPPSPTTLRRSLPSGPTPADPRLDGNFSAVIAKRAAESKARRHDNSFPFEFNSTGLPPSTTFFNNCVTTNRLPPHLPNPSKTPSFAFFQLLPIDSLRRNSLTRCKTTSLSLSALHDDQTTNELFGRFSLFSGRFPHGRNVAFYSLIDFRILCMSSSDFSPPLDHRRKRFFRLDLSHQQRFSATANQLLENLKRRGGTTAPTSVHY